MQCWLALSKMADDINGGGGCTVDRYKYLSATKTRLIIKVLVAGLFSLHATLAVDATDSETSFAAQACQIKAMPECGVAAMPECGVARTQLLASPVFARVTPVQL